MDEGSEGLIVRDAACCCCCSGVCLVLLTMKMLIAVHDNDVHLRTDMLILVHR